jgi:hypothetical protein
MSMSFEQAMAGLQRWFDENNLSTDSMTLIFNFSDDREAGQFDMVLRHALEQRFWFPVISTNSPLDLRKMTMNDLKIRVESPLHAEPK